MNNDQHKQFALELATLLEKYSVCIAATTHPESNTAFESVRFQTTHTQHMFPTMERCHVSAYDLRLCTGMTSTEANEMYMYGSFMAKKARAASCAQRARNVGKTAGNPTGEPVFFCYANPFEVSTSLPKIKWSAPDVKEDALPKVRNPHIVYQHTEVNTELQTVDHMFTVDGVRYYVLRESNDGETIEYPDKHQSHEYLELVGKRMRSAMEIVTLVKAQS